MSSRRDIFLNNSIYHIFNKTIFPFKSFEDERYSRRFMDICTYYMYKQIIPYSKYYRMNEKQKSMVPHTASAHVEILTYCLMPNHYHFQLKQLQSDGIRIFISNVINAFTRYYNILNERKGPLFLPVFHSQIAYSVEQLLHTSRYIHLNPVKDGLVKNFSHLHRYSYSSFNEYAGHSTTKICNSGVVMHYFDDNVERYMKFLADDVEHQKVLANLKKLKKKNQYTIYRGNASKNRLS